MGVVELDAAGSALIMGGKEKDGYHQAFSAIRTTWKWLYFLKEYLYGE